MRILHLLNSNKFSGAENVACQIISMFKDTENVIMAYCSPNGPINTSLKDRKVPFIPLSTLNRKELKKAINIFKPDIIHAHDMRASFIASLVCKKIPIISHIHNNNFNSRKLSIKSIAYYFAAKKAKHIFWVSESSFHGYCFHKKLIKKSSILCNIIDVDDLYKRAQQDKNEYNYDVIFLGRLTTPKNPMRLIDICANIVALKKDVNIAICGSGNLSAEVEEKAKKMGLLSNIDFIGYKSNPYKILLNSKVMIMTSLWEGMPMCALEAMSFGIPIVSTPVDGLKNLIVNDWNGFLSDDNDMISRKIVEIVNDEKLLNILRKNQLSQSKRWNDVKSYKTSLLNYYENSIK